MLRRDLVRSIHYLARIHDRKVHRALGYASITDYAAAVAGFTRNQTEVFLALGRRLDAYPEVRKALESGELPCSKARLIVERATPEEERRWVDAASRLGVRALKRELPRSLAAERLDSSVSDDAGRRAESPESDAAMPKVGEPPAVPSVSGPQPADTLCHVTYSFTPEEYAVWSTTMEHLRKRGRKESKARILIDALSMLIDDTGTGAARGSRFLLQIHKCPACRMAQIHNARGRFRAPVALLAAAECDAVVEDTANRRRSTIPPRLRREVVRRDDHRCQASGCRHTMYLEVHHRVPSAQGGRTELGNLITLCSGCHRELHRREAELREDAQDPVTPPI